MILTIQRRPFADVEIQQTCLVSTGGRRCRRRNSLVVQGNARRGVGSTPPRGRVMCDDVMTPIVRW